MEFARLSNQIIGCCISVHEELGPVLLDSTYERCLSDELISEGFQVKAQHHLTVNCKGLQLECGYGIDLLVEDKILIELKAVDKVSDVHKAQMLTYMK